jgi:hypothetical protein
MKRETFAMVAKAHVKNVIVVGPIEALGVRSDVDEVRGVMADGVHLDEKALDVLVDYMLKKARSTSSARRGGPLRGLPQTGRGCGSPAKAVGPPAAAAATGVGAAVAAGVTASSLSTEVGVEHVNHLV